MANATRAKQKRGNHSAKEHKAKRMQKLAKEKQKQKKINQTMAIRSTDHSTADITLTFKNCNRKFVSTI